MSDFDPERIRPLILSKHGNITKIASELKCDSEQLRRWVQLDLSCSNAMAEVTSRGVDKAVAVLFEGLNDDHFGNQLSAAKEFLKTRPAQRRGFHHAGDLELKMPRSGALTLTWLPPEEKGREPPTIEGTATHED